MTLAARTKTHSDAGGKALLRLGLQGDAAAFWRPAQRDAVRPDPLLHLRRDVAAVPPPLRRRPHQPRLSGERCCGWTAAAASSLRGESDRPDTVKQLLLDEIARVRARGRGPGDLHPLQERKIRPTDRKPRKRGGLGQPDGRFCTGRPDRCPADLHAGGPDGRGRRHGRCSTSCAKTAWLRHVHPAGRQRLCRTRHEDGEEEGA